MEDVFDDALMMGRGGMTKTWNAGGEGGGGMGVVCAICVAVLAASLPLILDGLDVLFPWCGVGRRLQMTLSYGIVAVLLALPQLGMGLLLSIFAPYFFQVQWVSHSGYYLVVGIGAWIHANIVVHYVRALTTFHPLRPTHTDDGHDNNDDCSENDDGWWVACRACGGDVVQDRDHHCPALGKCVGRANVRSFVLFVLYVWVGSVYATGVSGMTWWECGGWVHDVVPRSCSDLEGMHILFLPMGFVLFPLTLFAWIVLSLAFSGHTLEGWVRSWRTPDHPAVARSRPPYQTGWRLLLDNQRSPLPLLLPV